jgi:hypothetical protein
MDSKVCIRKADKEEIIEITFLESNDEKLYIKNVP